MADVAGRVETPKRPVIVLEVVRRAGLRVALASSSPLALIEGVLERFDLRGAFEQVSPARSASAGASASSGTHEGAQQVR